MYNKKGITEEQRQLLLQHQPVGIGLWHIPIAALIWFMFAVICVALTSTEELAVLRPLRLHAATALTVVILMVAAEGRPDRAFKKWWSNNVRGNVAEFGLDEDGNLQLRILSRMQHRVWFAERNPLNYFVVLGGWFFRTSAEVGAGSWLIERYESSLCIWAGSKGSHLYVYVEDFLCSKVKMSLVDALNFVRDAARSDWRNSWDLVLPDLLEKRSQRFILGEGIDKTIDEALASARHRQSKSVAVLRQSLEKVLQKGAPELVHERIVLNVPLSKAATSGMAVAET